MSQVGIAIVGCGYWGQNLVRNFWEQEGARLLTVCDLDGALLARTQRRYPSVEVTRDYQEALRHPGVDAVVLATPVSTHYAFAKQALEAGKHVLVEKPLTTQHHRGAGTSGAGGTPAQDLDGGSHFPVHPCRAADEATD